MRLAVLALWIAAVASVAGTASARSLSDLASGVDTCDVLTARQVQVALPGKPRVTDDANDARHVANVCNYTTGLAHVGGQFAYQLYSTRAGAQQTWDQFVASEKVSPPSQRATPVGGVGEHAYLETTGKKSPNKSVIRIGRIFWLQGRYVFQIQVQVSGNRKLVSARTLKLGREAAAKLKGMVD